MCGVPRDAATRELQDLGLDFEDRLVRREGSVKSGSWHSDFLMIVDETCPASSRRYGRRSALPVKLGGKESSGRSVAMSEARL